MAAGLHSLGDAGAYSLGARLFHWLTLVLIAVMFYLAWSFDDLKPPMLLTYLGLHKSIGMTILGLTVIRLIWRFVAGVPPLPGDLPRWQAVLARANQAALYILLLAQPTIGFLASCAGGHPVTMFGLIALPQVIAKNPPLAHRLFDIHGLFGWLLLATIALHACGALYHHFVRRDRVLMRMLAG